MLVDVTTCPAEPNELVVFRNLQSFAIDADAKLISKILDEDGVDSASLNVGTE